MFAFKLADGIDNYTVFDVSNALRARGWLLPAYTFPKNRTHLAALRVVVRRGVTHDLADLLIADIKRELALLKKQSAAPSTRATTRPASTTSWVPRGNACTVLRRGDRPGGPLQVEPAFVECVLSATEDGDANIAKARDRTRRRLVESRHAGAVGN